MRPLPGWVQSLVGAQTHGRLLPPHKGCQLPRASETPASPSCQAHTGYVRPQPWAQLPHPCPDFSQGLKARTRIGRWVQRSRVRRLGFKSGISATLPWAGCANVWSLDLPSWNNHSEPCKGYGGDSVFMKLMPAKSQCSADGSFLPVPCLGLCPSAGVRVQGPGRPETRCRRAPSCQLWAHPVPLPGQCAQQWGRASLHLKGTAPSVFAIRCSQPCGHNRAHGRGSPQENIPAHELHGALGSCLGADTPLVTACLPSLLWWKKHKPSGQKLMVSKEQELSVLTSKPSCGIQLPEPQFPHLWDGVISLLIPNSREWPWAWHTVKVNSPSLVNCGRLQNEKEGPIGHRLHICLLHTSLRAPGSRLGLIEPCNTDNPQAGVGILLHTEWLWCSLQGTANPTLKRIKIWKFAISPVVPGPGFNPLGN